MTSERSRASRKLCLDAPITSVVVAVFFFKMPVALAGMRFLYGVASGILKIARIVLAAVYLYDISFHTGQFEIMKESVAGITADRRLQVPLVAFCFGAFIEGAAGSGAPVAWGAIGTPIHTLAAIVGIIVMLYAYVFPGGVPHGLTFVK